MRRSPPSNKPGVADQSLLRLLGGVLAFLSMLLALLGIIVHQRVPDLILASIVGIFSLRVLILWLGESPQHQRRNPGWSSLERIGYPPQFPPGRSAPFASPPSPSQPLSQPAPGQHPPEDVPLAPTLPRSIRPQRPPIAPVFPAPPPPTAWLPPSYATVPMPSSAPIPEPSRQEMWQYEDAENCMQQGENDHGTA